MALMNKPFLKWLGGKTRLVKDIRRILPRGERFVEPFMGSGAVFLNMNFNNFLLADSNFDLINLYTTLQKQGRTFIDSAKALFTPDNNTEKKYNELRDEFNTTQDQVRKATIFVYLNRHGFNGACRYNLQGEFNIPFGTYANPVHFPAKEMCEFVLTCRNNRVEFLHADFRETLRRVKKGDVVYADPPYVPLSETSNFTSYDMNDFKEDDQKDLATRATMTDVPFLISNHDTEYTRKIYKKASYIETIYVGRHVGGERKPVKEILALFNFKYNRETIWNN